MSGPKHQHEAFHDGLVELQNYAKKFGNRPDEYQWITMKSIIDNFAPPLVQHLTEEIDDILALRKTCDSEGLKVSAEAEAVAKANGNIGMLVSSDHCLGVRGYLREVLTWVW
jgi:hypothetical protein